MILSVLFLTGCLNPVSVSVVTEMYKEALLEEEENVAAYFSDAFLDDYSIDELTQELASHVRNAGGIQLLNTVEIKRNQLNEAIVTELDETYEDDWFYIALESGKDEIMTWIVLRTSTHYEIVDGEKMTVDAYNENVLR